MTWAFGYLLILIVGLVLAVASGTLRALPFLPAHRHLVVPHPEQRASTRSRIEWLAGLALAAAGAAGLAIDRWADVPLATELAVSGLAGLLAAGVAALLRGRQCEPSTAGERATVVRAIGPRGFGQVRLGTAYGQTVVAARSVDDAAIPEGAEVEIVDCSRSVLIVRPVPATPP